MGEGKSAVLRLHPNSASDAAAREPAAPLRGEQLAMVSAEEEAKWPIGIRILTIIMLAVAAWLAVIYLPGLLTEMAGYLLNLLLDATE